MDDNFLAAEPLLLAHIRAAFTPEEVPIVGTMADMAAVEEQSQRTPAIYVIFDSYTPGQATAEGRDQKITQRWLAVVAVRNVAGTHTGAAAREDAGAILGRLMPTLQAFRPSPQHSRLTMSAPPAAVYREGFAYLPTAWETSIVTHHDKRNTA